MKYSRSIFLLLGGVTFSCSSRNAAYLEVPIAAYTHAENNDTFNSSSGIEHTAKTASDSGGFQGNTLEFVARVADYGVRVRKSYTGAGNTRFGLGYFLSDEFELGGQIRYQGSAGTVEEKAQAVTANTLSRSASLAIGPYGVLTIPMDGFSLEIAESLHYVYEARRLESESTPAANSKGSYKGFDIAIQGSAVVKIIDKLSYRGGLGVSYGSYSYTSESSTSVVSTSSDSDLESRKSWALWVELMALRYVF